MILPFAALAILVPIIVGRKRKQYLKSWGIDEKEGKLE